MSEPLEIPMFPETPLYTERIILDGKEYLFRFDWNGREGRWYLDIGTVNQIWLRTGIKVVANWPLLRTWVHEDKPPGVLMAVDLSPNQGEPPGFYDCDTRVKLIYYPVNG